MSDTNATQLTTLWFAVLILIETGSGGGGPLNMAIGLLAILLMWILPPVIAVKLVKDMSTSARPQSG